MPKKSSAKSVTFDYTVPIEASIPEFEPLASLASLDLDRLSKGSHKIEVGFFKGGCCSKLVSATVKNGMVTGIEVEPCKNTEKPPPEIQAIIDTAARKLGLTSPGDFKPVPIGTFAKSASGLIIINGGCIQICLFRRRWCITCCWSRTGGFGCTTDPIIIRPL